MSHTATIVLKTDPLLGLYARVEDQAAKRMRTRLAKMDIRFTLDPEQAAHLAEPEKRVFVFGGQHPLGVRDAITTRDMAVEVDPAVVLAETTYRPPLEQLLRMGEPSKQGKVVKYTERGIGHEHVPELIRMATDEALHTGPADSEIYWAPVHSWWALGELRAEEAIGPLLGLLRRVDEEDDDWVDDDIPDVLAEIGPAALEPTAAYIADPAHDDWARITAAKAIALIGQRFPKTYDECVARLTAQLERYATQSPTLNAFLILPLLDLGAEEAAPVMEKAFAAGRVDEDVGGDWEDIQIELGLKADRENERKPTKLMEIGAKLRAVWTAKTTKPEEPALSPPERALTLPAVSTKVGRNEPCPCGSGKKYKKCCLQDKSDATSTDADVDVQTNPTSFDSYHDHGLNLHPYAIVKMTENPSPEVLARLPKHCIGKLKTNWTITKVAQLDTADIMARLDKLGVNGDKTAFMDLAKERISAWSIGQTWCTELDRELAAQDDDFICLAACELWKRYCPERPSIEMVDDWVSEGYDRINARENDKAIDIWLRVWDVVCSRIQPHMTTFDAADPVFDITQSFNNWIQDFTMELENAAIDDRKYADIGIRLTRDILEIFVHEDLHNVLNFRCSLGKLLFLAGRHDEGEATLQAVISEYPCRACGYVELSDQFGVFEHGQPDYPRAIKLLEQALSHPVEDADDWDIVARLADLRAKMANGANEGMHPKNTSTLRKEI